MDALRDSPRSWIRRAGSAGSCDTHGVAVPVRIVRVGERVTVHAGRLCDAIHFPREGRATTAGGGCRLEGHAGTGVAGLTRWWSAALHGEGDCDSVNNDLQGARRPRAAQPAVSNLH